MPPEEPNTILLAYRGSIAHGMAERGSGDVDLMGIAVAPLEHYFGFAPWGSRGTKEYKQESYDVVYYEIRKAFALLLEGNPNALSLLWLRPEHYLRLTPAGERLLENRRLFAGKHVYEAFAGYAGAQMQKLESRDPAELREYLAVTAELKYRGLHPNHKGERFPKPRRREATAREVAAWPPDKLLARLRAFQKKGENLGRMGDRRKRLVLEVGYDARNAAHSIRLLRMCREFLITGELTVYRPDAAELLAIKRGEWPLERVKEHAAELSAAMRSARDASPLPDAADRDAAERLLVSILRETTAAPRANQPTPSLG